MFLSVDPVTAFSRPGFNFNRYWYANNNPYKFVDPDGRYSCDKAICGKVRKIVRSVRRARDNAKRGSDDRRRLDAVVRHIGTENGKGPRFVSAELEEGTAAKADQKGTIKIDFGKLEGRGDAAIEGGRSVTHEVKHDLDAKTKGIATSESAVRAREVEAYRSENSFLRQNGMEMTEEAMQIGVDKSVEQWKSRQP